MTNREYAGAKDVRDRLDVYVDRANAGQRFVIRRYGRELACLIGWYDLLRFRKNAQEGLGELGEQVNISLMRVDFARYVTAAAEGARYWIVNHASNDSAGLVSLWDLRELETIDQVEDEEIRKRDAKFRQALQEAGVEVAWPTGEPAPTYERVLIELKPGEQPLSEQIIAERR